MEYASNAFFESRPADESDVVQLGILLARLHSAPAIVSADVVWGHPSGHIEEEFLPNPVPFSMEQLVKLVEQLPILFAAFERSLERGRPPD